VSGSGRVIRGGAFQAPCPCGFLAWRIQSATADPGYLFSEWTGDATGTANPLMALLDTNKTINAAFVPASRDPDGDGLTNYQENVTCHSNPNVADTDGEGFNDGYEVNSGFDPNKETSTPARDSRASPGNRYQGRS